MGNEKWLEWGWMIAVLSQKLYFLLGTRHKSEALSNSGFSNYHLVCNRNHKMKRKWAEHLTDVTINFQFIIETLDNITSLFPHM
jgi:hypothetical protein